MRNKYRKTVSFLCNSKIGKLVEAKMTMDFFPFKYYQGCGKETNLENST